MTIRAIVGALAIALVLSSGCTLMASHDPCGLDGNPRMTLVALDATDGRVRWKHDDLPLYANLYTHLNSELVVVSNGGTGQTFNIESGEAGPPPPGTVPVPLTIGATRSTSPVPSSLGPTTALDGPLLVGSTMVVVAGAGDGVQNGSLVAYDPASGEQKWSYPLDRPSHSPPMARNGIVVLTTGDSTPSCG